MNDRANHGDFSVLPIRRVAALCLLATCVVTRVASGQDGRHGLSQGPDSLLGRSGRTRRSARAEVRRRPGGNESKMTGAGRGGKTVPLGHQEPISCDAQRGVMVEPAPVAAFKVPQPQLLFQLLVVPFDDPAVFGHLDQSLERGSRQSVDIQYLVGSVSPRGHSISNHSSARGGSSQSARESSITYTIPAPDKSRWPFSGFGFFYTPGPSRFPMVWYAGRIESVRRIPFHALPA